MCLGGTEAEATCSMGGKWEYPGPTNQLTGSPEPSPEPPGPEEDMNAEHTGLHDPPFSFTAWWPPTRGAGGYIQRAHINYIKHECKTYKMI